MVNLLANFRQSAAPNVDLVHLNGQRDGTLLI
jgi:hypothetical protein